METVIIAEPDGPQFRRLKAINADLLAALEAIVTDAESGQCEEDILSIARAAIAKAKAGKG